MKHLLLTTIAAVVLVGCGPPARNIWQAAYEGNIETVKQHLANGVDVNARGGIGETPLYDAVLGGHNEIIELLIAEGADVNATESAGNTPLHFAVLVGRKEVADLLRKHGGKTGEELKAEVK